MKVSRILLVDDMPSSLETMAMLFELQGFEVKTAKNGEEAVASVRSFQPDLILMDLQMPVKDGYEATKEIRAISDLKQPEIVALSGWDLDRIEDKIKEAGFDKVLTKPVSSADIKALVSQS
ncbi:MAG: response regulator [Verrucomicrobiales bacterium]|nr:response regulator [Verrucomicrobiales bacterium]